MLALAAPLTTQAQTSEWFSTQQTYEPSRYFDHRWYLTPFGTYTWGDNERQADDGWGGGLTVGRPVHPNWNLEFRTAYEELDEKSGGPGKWQELDSDARRAVVPDPARRPDDLAERLLASLRRLRCGRHQRRRRRLRRVELGAECRRRHSLAILELGPPRGRRALPVGQQQRPLRRWQQLRGRGRVGGSPDPAWRAAARGRSAARRAPAATGTGPGGEAGASASAPAPAPCGGLAVSSRSRPTVCSRSTAPWCRTSPASAPTQ